MICAIRIRGMVGVNRDVEETLFRLRLRKKYACVVLPNPTKEQLGMVASSRNFIAYGEIDKQTFVKLLVARGKSTEKSKKFDPEKAAEKLIEGKTYEELSIKPFFSMHPPRKGIQSKIHYPKGVLGNHGNKINELLERML